MRYFGQPRHTGDQQCDMCGCWVHGERMHLAGGLGHTVMQVVTKEGPA